MENILVKWIRLFLHLSIVASHIFTDDNWDSYNAYGLKLTANHRLIVEVRNSDSEFLVHIGSINTSSLTSPCHIDYENVGLNETSFVYSATVSTYANSDSFVFNGENDDNTYPSAPFVGHVSVDSSCNISFHLYYFIGSIHEEFYIIGVDPIGHMAYGLATHFAFSYDLNSHVVQHLSSWPIATLMPRAIDVNINSIAIVAGYQSTVPHHYRPIVYTLQMNVNSYTILDTWEYVPTIHSWQSQTSNKDAGKFTTKHTMSVAIHDNTSQVLVGISSMNSVF